MRRLLYSFILPVSHSGSPHIQIAISITHPINAALTMQPLIQLSLYWYEEKRQKTFLYWQNTSIVLSLSLQLCLFLNFFYFSFSCFFLSSDCFVTSLLFPSGHCRWLHVHYRPNPMSLIKILHLTLETEVRVIVIGLLKFILQRNNILRRSW